MDGGDGGFSLWRIWNTYTAGVMLLICTCRLVRWFLSRFPVCSSLRRFRIFPTHITRVCDLPSSSLPQPSTRTMSTFISDSDLKHLLEDLDCERLHGKEEWEKIIDRTNHLFSYSAKCYKPKDEPLKYLSTTVFENCSPELLRDFYMDLHYRKCWDKTLIQHEQLQVDESSGTEIGRSIKKFPFLTPREYVLAWRMWQDGEGVFYCLSKGCEHPLAPKQKKFVRVSFFRSGWRIRKVPGRNACEIKMVHQEDAGMNAELAKLAFAKGIWSYICRMDNALRKYTPQMTSKFGAMTQTFPPGLDSTEDIMDTADQEKLMGIRTTCYPGASNCSRRKVSKKNSGKLIKNGLILLGGAICLSRGHSSLGAKVAMAYILTKLTKHNSLLRQNRSA